MIVMKFGGTSVGDVDAFSQVITVVKQMVANEAAADPASTARPGVAVVTSAMGGVTNLLIDAATRAAQGDEEYYKEVQDTLLLKHQFVAGRFIEDGGERAALSRLLDARLHQFSRLCSSIAVLGELTDRGLDVVSGLGERMSAPLLAAVLRAQGVQAEFVDAGELIITDDVFGGAAPIMEQTEARVRARLIPMIDAGVVPVITGFVGSTVSGVPSTLGRGGSDYSASIIGACLDADEIQIWTDVSGVMTADPRVVPDARSIHTLSYEEVAELAYYGAKVLHPKTATPAVEKNIPLRVLNTFEPDHPGTLIVRSHDQEGTGMVKAISAIREMTMITVSGRGMMGVPGIAARTFGSVADVDANVLMISQSSSEQSICFVVPDSWADTVIQALEVEFERELGRHYIDCIEGKRDVVILAVVGGGMRGTPGLAAGVFTALGHAKINVIAIAQGSSEANISLVISQTEMAEALRSIHRTFELHKPTEERRQTQ